MHELGIAQGMIQTALATAAKNHATRVVGLNIEMSTIADECEESLRFHFENLTQGTIAEGMRANIVRVSMQMKCLDCGQVSTSNETMTCPHCASTRLRLVLQDEFRLVSIDVE